MTDRSGLVEGDLYAHRETIAYGKRPALTRASALAALGPVVYAVRVGDRIKIGYTSNLYRRLKKFGVHDVLAFRPGTFDTELEIHHRLSAYAVEGREWYAPVPEVLAVVNEMRAVLGLEPVAA